MIERYVDGYVLPVPSDQLDAYRELAAEAGAVWMEHGALQYVECVGDDLDPDVNGVEMATFPEIVETASDETLVFAFVVFKSREHRDEVNAAVMADPAMDPGDTDAQMPFDVARMAYGGFRSVVAYEA